MAGVKQIGSKEAFDKIIGGDKPVLADFFATWCGPCQMMGPMLDEMAKSYKNIEKVEIIKIDIDQFAEIAADYKIMSVPAFIIFNKGKVEDTLSGMRSTDELETKLDKLIVK